LTKRPSRTSHDALVKSIPNLRAFAMHQSIFDPIVHHFDEMTCSGRTRVQIAHRGPRISAGTAFCVGQTAGTRSERLQNRIDALHRGSLPADHEAIASSQSPNATGRSNIDVIDAVLPQILGAADIVAIERVAAVDDRVAGDKASGEGRNHLIRRPTSRQHEPNVSRRSDLPDEIIEIVGGSSTFIFEPRNSDSIQVIDDASVPRTQKSARDSRPHTAQAYNSDVHDNLSDGGQSSLGDWGQYRFGPQ
jgi:hypothetical protein